MAHDKRSAAKDLAGMGRGGDTLLAHITPQEARMLHRSTDGGSINPRTGLLEFYNGDDGGYGGDGGGYGGDTAGHGVAGDVGMGMADPGATDFGENGFTGPDETPSDYTSYGAYAPSGDTAGRGVPGIVGMGMANPGDLNDQMFNAGMNINNPFDRAIASVGSFFGMPPDTRQASPMTMFGIGGGIPGMMMASASDVLSAPRRSMNKGLFGLAPEVVEDYDEQNRIAALLRQRGSVI